MPSVFIDGEAGTTGLGIRARLAGMDGITLRSIPDAHRKDARARSEMYASADLVIMCLPDEAAREAVMLADALAVAPKMIDASSAHRVAEGWVYGFAELAPGQADAIAGATRVTNPGCYPTGAIALLRPLIAGRVLAANVPITINAISGYSGGGRAMIEAHEAQGGPPLELYALNGGHKHLPEIALYSSLASAPVFVPSVGHFPQGMVVSVSLHRGMLGSVTAATILRTLIEWYAGTGVGVEPGEGRIIADALAGTDAMSLRVHEAGAHVVLTATLDNLGKGASGAAVQNARLMLGLTDG